MRCKDNFCIAFEESLKVTGIKTKEVKMEQKNEIEEFEQIRNLLDEKLPFMQNQTINE